MDGRKPMCIAGPTALDCWSQVTTLRVQQITP